MSIEPNKIIADDLYRLVHDPFSLPESRRLQILEAIDQDAAIEKAYKKLLEKAGFE